MIYVNKRWSQISGISAEKAMGNGWLEVLHPNDRESVLQEWYQTVKENKHFSREYRFLAPNGKVSWVHRHAEPLNDEGGKRVGYIGTITDITARKKMEEEKLTGRKLEAIGILAGGIAHDFNNLLSVITGNISMLKMEENIRPTQHLMLTHMENSSTQAADLAQKLITFSKGGWLSKKSLSLSNLVEEVLETSFPHMAPAVRLNINFPIGLKNLEADETQLKQVLFNLIQNALEAVQDNPVKEIIISAQNMEYEKGNLPLDKGSYVKVNIADNGPGIPEERIGKVFDPYFTTKPMGSQKGLGLGLTLCYSIAKKHNGYIRVISPASDKASDSNPGTLLELFLPTITPATEKVSEETPQAPPPSIGNVLVVDDDEIIQDVIAQMLDRLGYRKHVCEEGRQAIDAYKDAMEKQDPFDILLIDLVNKKGLGGMETLKTLMDIDPNVTGKAIALSGYSDESDIQKLKQSGFREILFKPFKWKDLKELLENYFQKG